MVFVVVELTEEQRQKIAEKLDVDPPPTLLVCSDSKDNLKKAIKSFDVRKGTPVAELVE